MTKDYQIDIKLMDAASWNSIFSESYRIALWKEFVDNKMPKEHGFKNHVEGFLIQLKNNSKAVVNNPVEKWSIHTVDLGIWVGSEIISSRPCLVYKSSDSTLWEDVVIIPLTSAFDQKAKDSYDIFVPKDETNNLYQNSFARLRQLRAVSKKRLGKSIGKIESDDVRNAINTGIKKMLGVDN